MQEEYRLTLPSIAPFDLVAEMMIGTAIVSPHHTSNKLRLHVLVPLQDDRRQQTREEGMHSERVLLILVVECRLLQMSTRIRDLHLPMLLKLILWYHSQCFLPPIDLLEQLLN